MRNRQDEIRAKGFDMGRQAYSSMPQTSAPVDYNKIKVGVKSLDDAILNLGSLKSINRNYADKNTVLKALNDKDLPTLREISNYFYTTSGIYERICKYFAFLYRYDWYIVPEIFDKEIKEEKVLGDFVKLLSYLDNSHIKSICGDIALQVLRNGAYYGYIVPSSDGLVLQELPINYCRSRYFVGNTPAIEFNMRFFDDQFRDPGYRMRILKMFPDEFSKGYLLYKTGKLLPDYMGDTFGSWYLLEPQNTIKFNFNNSDVPIFVNTIPSILDLDAAQDLDRRKQMQKLLKIVIQKLPMDKNGDLIFDIDEARDIHNNAVEMLRKAIGVDVLTTFAEIDVADMSDKNTSTTMDDLKKVERTVFNNTGISQNLFNTDGNLSLEKSILNDEASARSLVLQFNKFFDRITQSLNPNRKKYNFRLYMLETTVHNYERLAKLYKEQVQLGYSKMLPQIALGHSQSSIINTAYFENEILHLSEVMIPPLMSSTLNGEDVLGKTNKDGKNNTQNKSEGKSTNQATPGRKEKPDEEKSDKTIKNKESMG